MKSKYFIIIAFQFFNFILTILLPISTPDFLKGQNFTSSIIGVGILGPIGEELFFRYLLPLVLVILCLFLKKSNVKDQKHDINTILIFGMYGEDFNSKNLIILSLLGSGFLFALFHVYGYGSYKIIPMLFFTGALLLTSYYYGVLGSVGIHIINNLTVSVFNYFNLTSTPDIILLLFIQFFFIILYLKFQELYFHEFSLIHKNQIYEIHKFLSFIFFIVMITDKYALNSIIANMFLGIQDLYLYGSLMTIYFLGLFTYKMYKLA